MIKYIHTTLLLVLISGPCAANQASANNATLTFNKDLLSNKKIGKKKAGLFCGPAGSVKIDDILIESSSQLVFAKFHAAHDKRFLAIKNVVVNDVHFNVCSKLYMPFGVGSVKGYSGKVDIQLNYEKNSDLIECKKFRTKLKDPVPLDDLWKQAFELALADCFVGYDNKLK